MKKRVLSMLIALSMICATSNTMITTTVLSAEETTDIIVTEENADNSITDQIVDEGIIEGNLEDTSENVSDETNPTETYYDDELSHYIGAMDGSEAVGDDGNDEISETDTTSNDTDISLMGAETYGNLSYTVSGNKVTITDCDTSVSGSLSIPAQINGMDVVSIGNNAFDGCSNLTSLTIPEGVTSLGYYMIRGTAISSITIPTTVTNSNASSSNGALASCTTLNEVIFTQGITKIPDYICASNSQTSYIENVVIPNSVQTIGSHAFYKNVNLGSITLTDNLITIGSNAFNGCTSIQSIDIPVTTKTIEYSAYAACTNLKSITTHYNDTVEWSGSIGYSAFNGCTSLTDVNIVGSFKTWGDNLFYGCTSLKELTIPEACK